MSTTDEHSTLDQTVGGMPKRLGPCRLERVLGSGGAGTVYLAEMIEARPYAEIGELVAVKVMHLERLATPANLERFLREADLGRCITHPVIVRTHEVDRITVGGITYYYLVMEYVEGRTLRSLMRQFETIPEALLRDLALQIATGLEAVHAAGAAHRDIKPGNVLITEDYQVKLMDLGVAFRMDEGARLTHTGFFVGTLLYAAPEQIRGEEVGLTADLYSLGVVLYEAATAHQPFEGGSPQAVIRRQLTHVPAKAGQLNPKITPFIEELIASLMEKEARARFASAAELAQVLREGEASEWWKSRESQLRAAHPHRQLRRVRVPRETSLVGRAVQLQQLRSIYLDVERGNGRVMLVRGEAGVGKTRLLDEFISELEAEGREIFALYGSNAPGGVRGASDALSQAVLDHLGQANLEAKLYQYLTITPRLVPAFAAFLTGTPAPEGSEPLSADALHSLFCYLASILAADRPVIWMVEDMHFASADARAMLLSLARAAHDHRLLLIVTYRPSAASEEFAHLEQLPIARRLTVDRLSEAEVVDLLSELLDSGSLAEHLGRKIAVQSDGNPFFIFEIIRELKESRLLREVPESASLTATGEITAVMVPATVRELLLGRLRELSQEQRALLDVGAVLGFNFDPDLVARVRGLKRLQVLETLAEIERRWGVVRATGAGFQFDHHQLQEVIYGALPPLLRREYHATLAECYEERERLAAADPAEMPGEAAVFLAEHFLKGDMGPRAFPLLPRALENLSSRYRNEALLELCELAVAALGERPAELRCDIRLRQAECLDLLGRRDEQRAAVEDGLAAARQSGDEARLARALIAQGQLKAAESDYATARERLEEGLGRARSAAQKETETAAIGHLGFTYICLGEYEKASQHYERQLGLAGEIGDRRLQALALHSLATALFGLGQYDAARERLTRSISVARLVGYRRGEARAMGSLGMVLHYLGRYEEARECLEESIEAARQIGFREGEAMDLARLGCVALDEGRLDEAGEHLESCLGLGRALHTRHIEGYALIYLAHLARARGQRDRALGLCQRALELCRELGVRRGEAETAVALGRHYLEEEEAEKARAFFHEAENLVRTHRLDVPGPLPAAYLAVLGDRDPASVTVGSGGHCMLRAEAHLALYRAGGDPGHRHLADNLLRRACAHLEGRDRQDFWHNNSIARAFAEQRTTDTACQNGISSAS